MYNRPVVAYLHNRAELPGLPPTVPVVKTLDALQEFFKTQLSHTRS